LDLVFWLGGLFLCLRVGCRRVGRENDVVLKYVKRLFFWLFLLVVAYLLIVLVWASAVAGELLAAGHPGGQADRLQPRHVAALVKIEDPTFYEHHGLDISNGQGVTTLTSVVARELFLRKGDLDGLEGAMQGFYRGVFNCCKRLDIGRDVMALVLDSKTTKQQQLDLYVSGAYFGSLDGKAVVGFEAAALAYFGKEPSRLTDSEFYSILAMPIAPNHYHPVRNPEVHAERAKRIAAVATGKCEANGWLDLTYEDCATAD
jgi:hypothetical protein